MMHKSEEHFVNLEVFKNRGFKNFAKEDFFSDIETIRFRKLTNINFKCIGSMFQILIARNRFTSRIK